MKENFRYVSLFISFFSSFCPSFSLSIPYLLKGNVSFIVLHHVPYGLSNENLLLRKNKLQMERWTFLYENKLFKFNQIYTKIKVSWIKITHSQCSTGPYQRNWIQRKKKNNVERENIQQRNSWQCSTKQISIWILFYQFFIRERARSPWRAKGDRERAKKLLSIFHVFVQNESKVKKKVK